MTLRRLLDLVKPYRTLLGLNIISNILVALFTVVSIPAFIPFLQLLLNLDPPPASPAEFAWSMSSLIDYSRYQFSELLNTQGREKALLYICILLIVLFLIKNMFRYLSLFFMAPVRVGIIRDLRNGLMAKFAALPLSYYSDQKKGDLLARVTSDTSEVEWSIVAGIEAIFRQPFVILGSLGFMVYVSPYLTMFVLVLLLFTGVIIGGISRSLKKTSVIAQQKQGGLIARVDEVLNGIKVIQSFGAEHAVRSTFEKENEVYRQTAKRVFWRRDLSSPLSEFLGISVFAVLLWFGAKLVFSYDLRPETFFAFLMAFFYIIEPAKALANAQYNVTKGSASLERIDEILNATSDLHEKQNAIRKTSFDHALQVDDVHFTYQFNEASVLSGVSLEIDKGRHIAIVGASGSGKSTLVDLIARFYDVSSGAIRIDGVDIRDIALKDIRALFGVVTQDPVLFHDTIYNNIALGHPDATPSEVYTAAKLAFAHDFILQTEMGYDTIIGDRGTKLSGGERQRITLARAVLKNPPILILDEATSALDSESESIIQRAFVEVLRNRTAIIIAHRLSTIQHSDEIIVMKNGAIIERGTHNHLIEKGGEYNKFASLQMG